jgi:ubiquitin-hydrolase Zn-finger-containing protein
VLFIAPVFSTQALAHCGSCELSTNLWLCLHCGELGCGRQMWDGTGGNGHALTHFQATGHPVVCKVPHALCESSLRLHTTPHTHAVYTEGELHPAYDTGTQCSAQPRPIQFAPQFTVHGTAVLPLRGYSQLPYVYLYRYSCSINTPLDSSLYSSYLITTVRQLPTALSLSTATTPPLLQIGTITPDGTADVHCYACDEEVVDPNLAAHLRSVYYYCTYLFHC